MSERVGPGDQRDCLFRPSHIPGPFCRVPFPDSPGLTVLDEIACPLFPPGHVPHLNVPNLQPQACHAILVKSLD